MLLPVVNPFPSPLKSRFLYTDSTVLSMDYEEEGVDTGEMARKLDRINLGCKQVLPETYRLDLVE